MEGRLHSIVGQVVGLICKLVGVQYGGEGRLAVMHFFLLESLHDDGSECDLVVVIVARGRRLLRDWDDGGVFGARCDNNLAQQRVKAVGDDVCDLLTTVPQGINRNVVRTQGSF